MGGKSSCGTFDGNLESSVTARENSESKYCTITIISPLFITICGSMLLMFYLSVVYVGLVLDNLFCMFFVFSIHINIQYWHMMERWIIWNQSCFIRNTKKRTMKGLAILLYFLKEFKEITMSKCKKRCEVCLGK